MDIFEALEVQSATQARFVPVTPRISCRIQVITSPLHLPRWVWEGAGDVSSRHGLFSYAAALLPRLAGNPTGTRLNPVPGAGRGYHHSIAASHGMRQNSTYCEVDFLWCKNFTFLVLTNTISFQMRFPSSCSVEMILVWSTQSICIYLLKSHHQHT